VTDRYTLGNPVLVEGAFTVDEDPADPAAVTLTILSPSGASTLHEFPVSFPDVTIIENPAVGAYEATLTPDDVGVWRWRMTGAGSDAPVLEGDFEITSVFAPQTYASLDRLLALFETRPKDARHYRLAQALQTATDELNGEIGRDYFRHPGTGTEEFLLGGTDVDADVLHIHRGLVELETLEVRLGGGAYTEVVADDFVVMGDAPTMQPALGSGIPSFHIVLRRGRFPKGLDAVRLTGALGWPAAPDALGESCAARARQIVFADPSYEGSIPSDEAYGRISVSTRWPHVFWKFVEREARRFDACRFMST
jgi:hypothetical protein